MWRARQLASLVGVLLLASCAGSGDLAGDAADEGGVTLLPGSGSETGQDTVRELVSRQRALFSAMLRRDTALVATYLEFRIAGSPLFAERVVAHRNGRPELVSLTPGVGYLALVNGYVPEGLNAVPEEFTVRRFGEIARVIARLDASDRWIITTWVLVGDEWLVTRMDAQTMDASLARRSGAPRR